MDGSRHHRSSGRTSALIPGWFDAHRSPIISSQLTAGGLFSAFRHQGAPVVWNCAQAR